jgi:hypothetical protein
MLLLGISDTASNMLLLTGGKILPKSITSQIKKEKELMFDYIFLTFLAKVLFYSVTSTVVH